MELQKDNSNSDVEFSEVSDTDSESETEIKEHEGTKSSNKCRMSTGLRRQLKLDPDVFTMDMETEEASQSQGRKSSQLNALKEEVENWEEQKPKSSHAGTKPAQQKELKLKYISPVSSKTINIDHKGDTGEMRNSQKNQSQESVSLDGDQGGELLKQEIKQDIRINMEELLLGQKNDPQEQAVPNTETDFLHSEDLGLELSLEFDTVPKPQPAMALSAGMQVLNEADEDSDPFEMIEE